MDKKINKHKYKIRKPPRKHGLDEREREKKKKKL
jgi:hypothetical protein